MTAGRAALQRARSAAGGDFWFRETIEGHLDAAAADTRLPGAILARLKNDPRYAQRGWLMRAVGDVDGSYAMWNRAIATEETPDALRALWIEPFALSESRGPRYQRLLARTGAAGGTRR